MEKGTSWKLCCEKNNLKDPLQACSFSAATLARKAKDQQRRFEVSQTETWFKRHPQMLLKMLTKTSPHHSVPLFVTWCTVPSPCWITCAHVSSVPVFWSIPRYPPNISAIHSSSCHCVPLIHKESWFHSSHEYNLSIWVSAVDLILC